jgi:hypothetical protein
MHEELESLAAMAEPGSWDHRYRGDVAQPCRPGGRVFSGAARGGDQSDDGAAPRVIEADVSWFP